MRGSRRRPSPAEFAREHPPKKGGRKCAVCRLPDTDLAVVNAARTEDLLTYQQIYDYIRNVLGGEGVTWDSVRGHFINGKHHERTS